MYMLNIYLFVFIMAGKAIMINNMPTYLLLQPEWQSLQITPKKKITSDLNSKRKQRKKII